MKAISILAYGADPTAQRLATSAIQQAINSAQQNDVIVIPQGRFLTGALFLKSGVSLRLDAGAQLVGSQDLADYPLINTRVAALICDGRQALLISSIVKTSALPVQAR